MQLVRGAAGAVLHMTGEAYDLVVIGYGGAGAAAAIEAAEAGASVLIVEKSDSPGGTTRMAGGNIRIVLDEAKMIAHIAALAEGLTDMASIEAHVRGLAELPEWIEQMGGHVRPDPAEELGNPRPPGPPYPGATPGTGFPHVVGGDGVGLRYRWPKERNGGLTRGAAAWQLLSKGVEGRPIDVLTGAEVTRLQRDGDRVTGIAAHQGGAELSITARRGVVLASGGFAWNKDMLKQWVGAEMNSAAPPHRNTGEGVLMAQAVGADLWHMNAAVISMGYKVPGYEATFPFKMKERGFILVDRNGRRFCDESRLAGHSGGLLLDGRDHHTTRWDRIPAYVIFDEATRLAGPITVLGVGYNLDYTWSADNGAEVEAGWIASADSPEALAGKLDLPGAELAATLAAYNRSAEAGADALGRRAEDCTPLQGGPLYGIALWPTVYNTQGGPRRAAGGEILDPFGAPISGLYGAGELGSIFGTFYPGGMNYGEAFVSGRVAGRSALGLALR